MASTEMVMDVSLNLQLPHFEQYLGLWAMHIDTFTAAVERVGLLDIASHFSSQQAARAKENPMGEFSVSDGVAIVSIIGSMTKYGSSLSEAGSTIALRRQIQNAARDPKIDSILMLIDSPGGTVAGNRDLADEVAAANKLKPVLAFIEDMGASAAYWVASQASKVYANPMGLVGSIGTYGVVYDTSGAAAREGVKALVFRSGEFKGAGVDGTEITPPQQAEFQRIVNEMNQHFLEAVSRGRDMPIEQVKALADGRVHLGKSAHRLGLVDGIQSFETTLNLLKKNPGLSATGKYNGRGNTAMSETQTTQAASVTVEPRAATYDELIAGCKGADPGFICKQQARKATLDQAKDAWAEELQARVDAKDKELEAEKAKSAMPGVQALGTGTQTARAHDGDPIEAWNEAVAEEVKRGIPKARAISKIVHRDPDLHQAYLEAVNANRRPAGRR